MSERGRILCVGTTPAVQRVMVFQRLVVDAVNRASTTLEGASGKSINVAKVLKVLGAEVVAAGFLGGDRGAFVREALGALGIEGDFVEVTARTRQCATAIDQSTGQQTELVEEAGRVGPESFAALERLVRERVAGSRAVVLSGTIAPGGRPDFYRRCVEWAGGVGAISVVDAQGPALELALEARPSLVKPNRAELAATVGRELGDEAAVVVAMRELGERGAARVVVTAGGGLILCWDGRKAWRVQPPRIRSVNAIGSGDSFTAAVVWRLVGGDDLGEACRWGAAAGAANALSLMPGELRREDVERLVGEVSGAAV